MPGNPDSPARRRRRDLFSIGIVAAYAWSLACLFLAQDAIPRMPVVVLIWLAGLAVIGGVAAWAAGGRARGRAPRR